MNDAKKFTLLDKVNDPADIRNFSNKELKTLAEEIRAYLIDVISEVGGHFGGSLGTVELTLALHKVFQTPKDKLIWDVGHQAYPHKVITGRRDKLPTIRQLNGLSGFLKRKESEYDVFGAGHATTSLSAALGIAKAEEMLKTDNKVVAIIGDGAMTGGMAYEAMNNTGVHKGNLIIVLNDNRMSIAPNVWQFSNYFSELTSSPEYNKFKGAIWDLTGKLDDFGDRIRKVTARLESGIKSIITPGILFEALGFRYFGPFNAHNIPQLVKIFNHVRGLNGPILVHVSSIKGKGYKPAEEESTKMHGVGSFDKITGKSTSKSSKPSYTSVFGNALVELAKENEKIVGITAAMPDGTGLLKLQKEMPERYYDVGIAEEHGVTFAAGLATQGVIPVVAIYSTFLQRAIDQIIHDVALQKLHVVFALDRGGLVGADGPTHHGVFDLTYLRMIPGMVVMAPKDENELRNMLYTAVEYDGPIAFRYPRGAGLGVELKEGFEKIPIGKAEKLKEGNDVAFLAVGKMVEYSLEASAELDAMGINTEVINMRFVKPLDNEMLDYVAGKFDKIITLEENNIVGGFGSGVLEYFNEKGYKNNLLRVGLPDGFVEQGTQKELHRMLKIDAEGIVGRVKSFFENTGKDHKASV